MTASSLTGWRAAAALILLNASLTFENVWPTPKIQWSNALSLELAACVVLMALAHRWAGPLTRRILPAAWVLLVAGHYLDVTAPGLYGRDFNLYWDSRHLGNVTAMLARDVPWWLIAAATGAALLLVVLAFVLSRMALGQVAAAMTQPAPRRVLGSAAALVIAIFSGQQLSGVSPVPFADPATGAYARQARYVLAMVGPGATAPVLGASPAFDSELRALGGDDVLLIFLESYGAVTFESPSMAAELAGSRASLDAAIRGSERQIVSAYVDSPTFGASSWLAHLSLLSGVEVRDQYAYTSLMASTRDTFLTHVKSRGYRTIGLMPGMRQPWPEGAFYGFDVIYGHDALEYKGPQFGWWAIPDQYALAKLDALERGREARAPVFVVFPTSTTHAPFGPVAPYQPNWSRVLTETPYDAPDVERAMAANPDLTNLTPSYVNAMAYDFITLAGYLREQRDDPVLVVIGDHQPPAAVSGRDAAWHVPVHVISRKRHVLQRLVDRGFRPGLEPQGPAIGAMHSLVPVFLDAFDAAVPSGETD
jgi:hypothetical protein